MPDVLLAMGNELVGFSQILVSSIPAFTFTIVASLIFKVADKTLK